MSFKRRSGMVRDPFVAFVCDDATAEAMRPICMEMGWPTEKINKGGLRVAVQTLSMSTSPAILFVDLSETDDPLNHINALAEVCEPGTLVIACGTINDVRLYRDLMASGLHDYILKPLSPDTLRQCFVSAHTALVGARQAEADRMRPHLMAAVIGVRGGVGASMVASSLAWLLARKDRNTALFDLDIHFGTSALAFDLEPGRGLTEALENPSRIDGLFLERAMVKAAANLSVLSAEASINQPLLLNGQALSQLQEEMRNTFDCVVMDMPRNIMMDHSYLLTGAHAVVIATELTLVGTRDTIRLLAWLKTHAPEARVHIVANKVQADQSEVGRKDFEASIERAVDLVLPADAKTVLQAARNGKCVADAGKGSKLAAALTQLADMLTDDGGTAGGAKAGSRSLIDNLRALLPARTGAPQAAAPATR